MECLLYHVRFAAFEALDPIYPNEKEEKEKDEEEEEEEEAKNTSSLFQWNIRTFPIVCEYFHIMPMYYKCI